MTEIIIYYRDGTKTRINNFIRIDANENYIVVNSLDGTTLLDKSKITNICIKKSDD